MKITIHRALAELKLIDAKIEKNIAELLPVGINQKGKKINNHIEVEDFKTTAQSKYDSINDLIKRKTVVKSAIVEANGKTMVKIADKEMSIADAINFKATVKFKKQLVDALNQKLNSAISSLNINNDKVGKNLQVILEATFGRDTASVKMEDIDNVSKPFVENNEFHLFDPLEVAKKIEALEKEISEFEAEVDAVLSEANAITQIEI